MRLRTEWFRRWCQWLALLLRAGPRPAAPAAPPPVAPAPREPEPPRAPDGRRCNLPTLCQSVSALKDEPWPATVRTIDRGSMRLVLKRRFEPSTLLKFDLENPAQSFTRTVFARVRRATAHGGGDWALDCTLSGDLAEDEVTALLS